MVDAIIDKSQWKACWQKRVVSMLEKWSKLVLSSCQHSGKMIKASSVETACLFVSHYVLG